MAIFPKFRILIVPFSRKSAPPKPKGMEDARLRQASEKFVGNEFEPPKAALGEYLDDTHSHSFNVTLYTRDH